MTHLTEDDLVRWQAGDRSIDRDKVITHLAVCDQCGARLAEIVRTRLPDTAPGVLSANEFVERGYRARRTIHRRGYWMLPMAAAAAAVVIVAVVVRPWRAEAPLTLSGDEQAIRGNTIRAVAPIGRVTGPLRFEWISPLAAADYEVDVTDTDGYTIYSGRSSSERLELPSDAEARVTPGRLYSL
jgi:hypothetical protein